MSLFSRIKYKIDRFWDNFRRRCQRFKRGWSYGDVWDIDVWFMHTVKPMLIHLKNNGISMPLEFNNGDGNRIYWENTLTEMINCLELMDEDTVREYLGIPDNDYSIESCKKISSLIEENKNRFFELFSKYFFDLWD